MGAGALALQAAGMGMSVGSSMNQADAQKNALNYETQVAANNAIIGNYKAGIDQQVGAQQEQSSRLQTAQLFGSQRATMAANGIDMANSGSATDILATTKYMGERDALTIQDNTAQRVWADKNNAAAYLSEAGASRAASDSINPTMTGVGTFLTGAGSFASNWYKYNQQTMRA